MKCAEEGPGSAESILNALASTVVVLTRDNRICYLNGAGETFFSTSRDHIRNQPLNKYIPDDSPLFQAIAQVHNGSTRTSEYGVTLESPKIGRHLVNIHAVPHHDQPGQVIVTLHERSLADQLDRRLAQHRSAVRSVSGMASLLAHEVKNPLSGIRGAAQLLELDVDAELRKMTRLICDETDRIVNLVDRMDVFTENPNLERGEINIHEVLERVHQVARNGFGKKVRFIERYDPSLPPVYGHFDSLVQALLNLVKNASEAVPEEGGEITLTTAYRHGVRLSMPGRTERVHLPLTIGIKDNGPGIPDHVQAHLFEAFVTSKPKGTGLGLALVAKIIDDHGGAIQLDHEPGGTLFRIMLPLASGMSRNTDSPSGKGTQT
ncbi:nitrogen regulation protein NR(II) [Magnetospira sp. QH-2]|uniref:two-component system sensor histidine kinase NtrB n=1 Tax=Magnetospira sp. (strain QH-2) TaxID=1288970 RepID=UPI0005FA18A9|nr:ATP-binding protein [Magnetospira sp. QH-2]